MGYTAQYFVDQTRQWLQVFGDASAFVDGFTPPGDGESSILERVNDALADLSITRARCEQKTIAGVVGQNFYTLEDDVIEFMTCRRVGFEEMSITSLEALRDSKPGWQTTANGNPVRAGRLGSQFFVWPAPNTTASITYRASVSLPVFTADTDELLFIPLSLQRKIPCVSALMLANVDAENPAHVSRKQFLQDQAYSLFATLWRLNTGNYADNADFDKRMDLPAYLSRQNTPYQILPAQGG